MAFLVNNFNGRTNEWILCAVRGESMGKATLEWTKASKAIVDMCKSTHTFVHMWLGPWVCRQSLRLPQVVYMYLWSVWWCVEAVIKVMDFYEFKFKGGQMSRMPFSSPLTRHDVINGFRRVSTIYIYMYVCISA